MSDFDTTQQVGLIQQVIEKYHTARHVNAPNEVSAVMALNKIQNILAGQGVDMAAADEAAVRSGLNDLRAVSGQDCVMVAIPRADLMKANHPALHKGGQ